MPASFVAPHAPVLERALCILVVVLIALAVVYSAWIAVSNYSEIRV
jgi:hypothetical protein